MVWVFTTEISLIRYALRKQDKEQWEQVRANLQKDNAHLQQDKVCLQQNYMHLEQDNVRIKRENKLLLMAYQLKNEGIHQKEQMIEKVKERMVLSEEDLKCLNALFLS